MSASVNEVIANDLRKSHALLQRAVGGLKPAEFEVQPCPGANCASWIVGHLVLTERRILGFYGVELPAIAGRVRRQIQPDPAGGRGTDRARRPGITRRRVRPPSRVVDRDGARGNARQTGPSRCRNRTRCSARSARRRRSWAFTSRYTSDKSPRSAGISAIRRRHDYSVQDIHSRSPRPRPSPGRSGISSSSQ